MKLSLRVVLPVLLLLVATTVMFGAGRVVNVPAPPEGTPVYLNEVILADTLANGARVDSNTTYVLARGGQWLWNNVLLNAGWSLNIVAATGAGADPVIYGYVQPNSNPPSTPYQFVDMEGPVYVKGIRMNGYLDIDPTAFASYGAPFIFFRRAGASPDRAEFYGNLFANCGQAVVGTFGAQNVIKFVDNVIANDGVPPLNDTGNGRVIDTRNVSLDSLIFVNNTLAYGFDRMIRHLKSVGRIDNFLFDHNTVYENGGRYGLMSLGALGHTATITNNLLVDPMAVGSDTTTSRQFDFGEAREYWPDGKNLMSWIYNSPLSQDTLTGYKTTKWTVSNNFYYVTPQIQAVYDEAVTKGWNPVITAGRPITDSISKQLADPTGAFIKLGSFAFDNVPPPFAGTVRWQIAPVSEGGTGGASSGGTFVPYEKHLTAYYKDTMSCAYSSASAAFTGGTNGLPVGDLNWFPAKKALWQLNGNPSLGRHVNVPAPPEGTPVYLNEVILADTLANGARVDSNTTYVLARGGQWLWNNVLLNAGWALRIVAAEGAGAAPQVYGYVQPNSNPPSTPYQFVDMEGPVYVSGVQINGYLDIDPTAFASYGAPFIFFRRAGASPDRAEFYGNLFTNCGQAVVGTFGAQSVIKFVDNIVANDGVPPLNDTGNGRVIDTRNVSLDSLIFVNNTLAYGFDRMIRHLKSVGRIDNFLFDHNTVYENGGRYGLMSLGALGHTARITNNLLVDPMAVGSDTTTSRQFDFGEAREYWPDGKNLMSWIYNSPLSQDTLTGFKSTKWTVSNNFYYVTPQIQAVYDEAVTKGWNPVITAGRPITDSIKAKLANPAAAFTKLDAFSFTTVPPPFAGTVRWQIAPVSEGGTGGASSGGTFVPYEKHLMAYYADTMDCAYSISSPAYSGGQNSFPAGDLNWFPAQKAAWQSYALAVEPNGLDTKPVEYSLLQNYPNPFNPSTQIEFVVPMQLRVTLKVYNLLGQEVASLVDSELPAGKHSVTFNASHVSSGVYFYVLNAGSFTSARKMLLMK